MYKLLSRKEIYDSDWITLYVDEIKVNKSKVSTYNFIKFKNESVVVIVKNEEKILLVNSYRYIFQNTQIEFPAGSIEDDESVLTAAKREVFEETGINIKNCRVAYEFLPSNGITDQKVFVVLADYLNGQLINQIEENESAYWLDICDLKKLLQSGTITDGLTLVSMLFL